MRRTAAGCRVALPWLVFRRCKASYGDTAQSISVYETADGKLEQLLISKND